MSVFLPVRAFSNMGLPRLCETNLRFVVFLVTTVKVSVGVFHLGLHVLHVSWYYISVDGESCLRKVTSRVTSRVPRGCKGSRCKGCNPMKRVTCMFHMKCNGLHVTPTTTSSTCSP